MKKSKISNTELKAGNSKYSNVRQTLCCCWIREIVFILLLLPSTARADAWGFPLRIADENTSVNFEVDSTWHLIHGRGTGVSGTLELSSPDDPKTAHGEINLPVNQLDTENSRRDKRMREVMDASEFSNIRFELSRAEILCDVASWTGSAPCGIRMLGKLHIRDVTRDWVLSGSLVNENSQYRLEADGDLLWADYNIKDPSIIVARLKPLVKVHIRSVWKTNQ